MKIKLFTIPNCITLVNLLCGIGSIISSLVYNDLQMAFAFVIASAVADFCDGFAARLLKQYSALGVQLDSLADMVSFGVAPAIAMSVLCGQMPSVLGLSEQVSEWLCYLPLVIALLSALRLAKFNIDERQHTGFIGMPTPANAIFWGAIITGSQEYLSSPRFNVIFLFAFMIMFCWLMVSEIRMFSLKFKNLSWEDNKVKYVFVLSAIIILLLSAGQSDGSTANTIQMLSRGVAGCIGLYILMSILTHFRRED